MRTGRSLRWPDQRGRTATDRITEAAARLAADAAERQGFPRVMSDPSVLSKIADILNASTRT